MAQYSVANTSLIPTLYSKTLWVEAMKDSFLAKFMGGEEAIIQRKTDLAKAAGATLNFGLSMLMTNTGVVGDDELKGNEEKLVDYVDTVTIDQIRNAAILQGRMEEKKAAYNLRETAKARLRDWLVDRLDTIGMSHLMGDIRETFPATALAPSSSRDLYAGDATSEATISDDDPFTAALLTKARIMAKTISPKIRPLKIGGKDFYVCFVHPYAAFNLKRDPDWLNAHYFASEVGLSNPIFDGSLGIYDGVVIHEHERAYAISTMGSGSNVEGARAAFCGRQAMLFAEGAGPTWDEEFDDYGNKFGAATGKICGFKKARFNSEDYGVITISSYAKVIS